MAVDMQDQPGSRQILSNHFKHENYHLVLKMVGGILELLSSSKDIVKVSEEFATTQRKGHLQKIYTHISNFPSQS